MDAVRPPHDARLSVFIAEERPALWEQAEASFPVVWPEYNLHGDVAGQYFGALFPEHANVQVLIYDDDVERIVARARRSRFGGMERCRTSPPESTPSASEPLRNQRRRPRSLPLPPRWRPISGAEG